MKKWLFVLLLFCVKGMAAVRILTFHYNEPSFVEMQYKTLCKFLRDDFELIVINDAKTPENEQGIEALCNAYGIRCIRFQPEWHLTDPINTYLQGLLQQPTTCGFWGWDAHTTLEEIGRNPSVRHSHVIQYALEHYGYDHDDVVVIMDSDNFLIQSTSFRELLGDRHLVAFDQRLDFEGIQRKRGQLAVPRSLGMPWVVFIAFRPNSLPHPRELRFHVDEIDDHPLLPPHSMGDTGAALHRYFHTYPHLEVQTLYGQDSGVLREYFTPDELKDLGFAPPLIQFIHEIAPGNVQFFAFERFLHFGAASVEDENHQRKVYYLQKLIQQLLEE